MEMWRVVMVENGAEVSETERFFLNREKAVEEACRQANEFGGWYDEISVDENDEVRIWTEDNCVLRLELKHLSA